MKRSILSTAIITSIFTTGIAHADLTLDADLETDTDATSTEHTSTAYDQNGRVAVNVKGRHTSNNYFVAAKGTLLLTMDGEAKVDDAYIQLGNNVWDVQLGRFEAINLFPLGKDTLVNHAGGVSVYGANKVRGRAGDDGGQIALHFNASENLKFEVNTIFGDDDSLGDNATAVAGIRPSVTFITDAVTISAGYESLNYDLTTGGDVSLSGYGITAGFNIAAANINVSAAHMKDDNTKQKVTSYAANVTYGNFGAGLVASEEDNAGGMNPEVMTAYAAYTVPLFDIKNASVTFAGSYSTADNVADDEAIGARMRLNYNF